MVVMLAVVVVGVKGVAGEESIRDDRSAGLVQALEAVRSDIRWDWSSIEACVLPRMCGSCR